MGATNFTHESIADNVSDAFQKAVEEARWEHGHGGYTGTIAEKPGYRTITVPGPQTEHNVQRFVRALYDYESLCLDARDGKPADKRRAMRKRDKLIQKWGHALQHAYMIYNEKWGPALGLRLATRKMATKKVNWKGEKWLFLGYASC